MRKRLDLVPPPLSMPGENAGKEILTFVLDVSSSMTVTRDVPGSNGEARTVTDLEYALQYVKLKIQHMVYSARKTEQCGIVTFGTIGKTNNRVYATSKSGYEYIDEFIPIAHPTTATLKKLDGLEPSEYDLDADAVDAIIVAIQMQGAYLKRKKGWTRKIFLVTNGKGFFANEDWESTVDKLNELKIELTVVGVDFDDDEFGVIQKDKPLHQRRYEEFIRTFGETVDTFVIGNLKHALEYISYPQVGASQSRLARTVIRIGDVQTIKRQREAMEILIRTSKCTAVARPKPFTKFAVKPKHDGEKRAVDRDEAFDVTTYIQPKLVTDYFVDNSEPKDDDSSDSGDETDDEKDNAKKNDENLPPELEKVEKGALQKGYKYGPQYVLCPDGQFPKLQTKKGIDLMGFVRQEKLRRDYLMGEIHYLWGEPDSRLAQSALSSIVQAMSEEGLLAVGRWVTADGRDPKMGVMAPAQFEKVHCLLWAPMPFANDHRKWTFPSLGTLRNKKGEIVTEHRYLPSKKQMKAMDEFVDALDLIKAGPEDDTGNATEWFDVGDSYNPSLHRLKQAMFHCQNVENLERDPLPPPHPELMKYMNPPNNLIHDAQPIIDKCIEIFGVKQVPRKVRKKYVAHNHVADEEDEALMLAENTLTSLNPSSGVAHQSTPASETDDDGDDDNAMLLDRAKPPNPQHLPTPSSPDGMNNDGMGIDRWRF
ncbi:SPOC like C-terminal domain-containing protein [Rhodocollybia butyracea]|uniref:ATP-dependent DNA helicase II subunit 2 n=1 Tax=Rhodocollybia butyracea TaxID=206335 RepID=A0A9P5UCB4_9AGAR|nr:SPOC like C-terminal domain-containing protein [Rhodocollybia butyracea]